MGRSRDPRRFRFRGRAAELDSLRDLLARTARGTGGALLVEGEPGIGKTRLIDEVLGGAEDLRVFRAAAEQLEQDRPYGVLADALVIVRRTTDAARAELAALVLGGDVPAVSSTGDASEARYRYRIVEGFVDLVEKLAREPMALVLEDLHWSDPGTVVTLHRLARSIEHLPVALVLTLRPAPRSIELAVLVAELIEAGSGLFSLGPLDEDDLRALAAEQLGATPGATLAKALAATGGNPLFATELTAALQDDELIDVGNGDATLKEASIPRSLQITILRRLGFLGREALEILRLASVLGTSFSLQELAVLSDRDEIALVRLFEEPLRARLIVPDGEQFSFRHDVVREAIYLDVPEAGRKSLHGRAAEALEAAGVPRPIVAPHVLLSARPGDDRAIEWLWEAGKEAALREPAVGVRLMEHALELTPPSAPRSASLRADLVIPLAWCGRLRDAEAVARDALQRGAGGETEVDLRTRLARCLVEEGRWGEAIAEFEIAAARTTDARKRARLMGAIASFRYDEIEAAIELAKEQGDDVALMLALIAETFRSLEGGRIEDALIAGRKAAGNCLLGRDPEAIGWGPHRFLSIVLKDAGLVAEARQAIADGRALAEEGGMSFHLAYYGGMSGMLNWMAGALDDAVTDLETIFRTTDGRFADAEIFAADLVHLNVFRGDINVVRGFIDRTVGQKAGAAHRARAVLYEAEGNMPAAAEEVRLFVESLREPTGAPSSLFRPGMPLVRIPLAAGAEPLAKEIATKTGKAASRTRFPRVQAVAKLAAGLVDRDGGQLLDAVDLLRSTECSFELATAALEAGECFLAMGDSKTGVVLLSEALEIFERSGAERLIAKAEAGLRSAGVRRGARARRGRPSTGWDSLTDTERAVLKLIIEGLTNPQVAERLFISKRTVETHVSHLFQKLEVASRPELMARAARVGPGGRIPEG